tara:strand:+ start:265 stop:474 length:210 start_codon:yes stop_codon:yes gene_type:complete
MKGKNKIKRVFKIVVPEAGLEPARPCERGILNPLCLPIPSLWQSEINYRLTEGEVKSIYSGKVKFISYE